MLERSFSILAAALVLAVPGRTVAGGDLLIRNARVVDGTGAPSREGVSILIRDGRITAIGPGLEAEGVSSIDAMGATVLPGLIDTHVHFNFAAGSAFRGDSPATVRELNRRHLRALLACGVTTVLDPGSFVSVARDIRRWLEAGNPGPRFLTTGPVMRPPNGYGHPLYGSVATLEDVEARLDLITGMGGAGVKLAIEEGFNPFGSFAGFSPEMWRAIRDGAARRRLPLYVHATTEAAQSAALDVGAHAILHAVNGGVWTGQVLGASDLSGDFVKRMAASGAYQLTTFSILDTWPGLFDTGRLADPLVRLVVPDVELATALDPAAAPAFAQGVLGWFVPWMHPRARAFVARALWRRENLLEGLRYSQRNIRRLHEAGVPIVAATDAPSPWPHAFYHFHGPQMLREVELLGDAGLSPMDAVAAATRVPAAMLGLADEVGTVEPGKRADLLILGQDPLHDLAALRAIRWTVKDGVARTPEQWMATDWSRGSGL